MIPRPMPVRAPRRWGALAALAVSVLVVGLDLFVLTLALPTLSGALHASTSDLQWFVDAYSLALAAALLPAGLLGDRFGRKKLLAGALVLFGIASLACAYSTSTGELIAARAVLGLAAAVILPLSLSVIPVLFSASERPRAIAVVGGATFLGYPIGPILGGWLLDHYWWGSVFLINVPVVVLAVIAVAWLMPESRSERRPKVDVIGALISSSGLAALTYGVIRAGQHGWSDAPAIAAMTAGCVALAAFAAWERAAGRSDGREPLVDFTLFRSAGFSWGTILATLVSFALFGITFAMPQYFLDVRGLDSLASGLRLLPLIGGLALGLGIGQRLQTPRQAPGGAPAGAPPVSARALAAAGLAVMAVALAILTGTTAASATGFVLGWFAVAGLGLGLAMPTALNVALSALSAERSGSGAAVMTAMRQVGATIGVAVLGTVLNSAYRSSLTLTGLPPAVAAAARGSVAGGVAAAHALATASSSAAAALLAMVRDAYAGGVDVMLWVCAGIAVAAALLAVAFLPRYADAPPAEPGTGTDGGARSRPGTTGRAGDADAAQPGGKDARSAVRAE